MTLHEAIEKVLFDNKRPMSPRELVDEINKRRSYVRDDGNDIPTSQISARVKNYPQYFYKDSEKKVCLANWEQKNESQKTVEKTNSGNLANIKDIDLLEKILINEKNYKKVKNIDKKISNSFGLYCIRINKPENLDKIFADELKERKHNILYFGIATESINTRLMQELRARGHGTFFRSLGAVLGYLPPKGSLKTKKNKRNYKFSKKDEKKIIKWINENLLVNWIEFNGDFESLETNLINTYKPILNIAKNPYSLPYLSELRAECVDVANS
ncbi:MAG: hypothetical protein PF485_12075 [Bacteroidales bacterium]|jgi:hypothetical protein|nr:hypothetical protein [Bacteroidales bacterium]